MKRWRAYEQTEWEQFRDSTVGPFSFLYMDVSDFLLHLEWTGEYITQARGVFEHVTKD